jgi:hypothetical protein
VAERPADDWPLADLPEIACTKCARVSALFVSRLPPLGYHPDGGCHQLKKTNGAGTSRKHGWLYHLIHPRRTLRHAFGSSTGSVIGGATHTSKFGEFELIEELGRGGTGIVCKARDLAQNRDVALKRFLPRYPATEDRMRRFLNETRIAARLNNHPHIVPTATPEG